MTRSARQNSSTKRRGGALVLVTIAIGVASVLGMSLLALSSLQSNVAANATKVSEASYLAESGVNIAMYYLQYPGEYTGAKPDGYYPGEAALNLGSSINATVTTEVTYDTAQKLYNVRATAQYTGGGANTSVREARALVKAIPAGTVTVEPIIDAAVLNGDVTIDSGMTFTGSPGGVRTLGKVRVASGGRVVGNVVSDDAGTSGTGEITGATKTHAQAYDDTTAAEQASGQTLLQTIWGLLLTPYSVAPATPTDPGKLVPAAAYVPDLKSYRYKNPVTGVTLTYNATKITAPDLTGKTMGTTILNPGGIYWADADVTLNNSTINGTLILTNGAKLKVGGGTNKVTANSGYPAIVTEGTIELQANANLTASGLVRGGKIDAASSGITATVSITGALMLTDNSNPIAADKFGGTFSVTYNQSKANVRGFGMSVADTDIKALQVVSWTGN